MSRFWDALRSSRVLLMDGAMGTQLQRAGLRAGQCPESWNLSHPGRVSAVHRAYVAAGSDCLLTNTFQSNPFSLHPYGLGGQVAEINKAAMTLAREAAGPEKFVLADIGPIPTQSPGENSASSAIDRFFVESFVGADGFLLETFSGPEGFDVVRRIRSYLENDKLPILLSLTYEIAATSPARPVTHSGHTPEQVARQAEETGIAALGINCGREIGIKEMTAILEGYRRATTLPLFARPNAGSPRHLHGEWLYPTSAGEMACQVPDLLSAGACMVGGCCGTTPNHIAALRGVLDGWSRYHPDA